MKFFEVIPRDTKFNRLVKLIFYSLLLKKVILALVYVAYSIDAAPALLNEISLKLQPPELPHHHHHHNSATPTKSSSTSTTSTTRKPTAEITHYEFVNLPDGYRFS